MPAIDALTTEHKKDNLMIFNFWKLLVFAGKFPKKGLIDVHSEQHEIKINELVLSFLCYI